MSTDRDRFIEEVKRRLDEYKTAPSDERQYTDYAHLTSLIHDIERLLDILGIEAIIVAEVDHKPLTAKCELCGGDLVWDGSPAWVCDLCDAVYDGDLNRIPDEWDRIPPAKKEG